MNTGELLYHIAIAINVVVFVISAIVLKGTRYKYSFKNFEEYQKQEWQTLKLAIWLWLVLAALCFFPILGAMACAFIIHVEISEKKRDKKYYISRTNACYKLLGILHKLYKWLLIKL